MPQDVRRYPFVGQGWTAFGGDVNVLLQDVLEAGTGHGLSSRVDEEFRHQDRSPHSQPSAQSHSGFLPQRQAALLSPFAVHKNAGLRVQRQIFEPKTCELGHTQPCGEAQVQHGTIANTGPRNWFRRIQERLNFLRAEVPHQTRISLLHRNGEDASGLLQS